MIWEKQELFYIINYIYFYILGVGNEDKEETWLFYNQKKTRESG